MTARISALLRAGRLLRAASVAALPGGMDSDHVRADGVVGIEAGAGVDIGVDPRADGPDQARDALGNPVIRLEAQRRLDLLERDPVVAPIRSPLVVADGPVA